MTEKVKPRTKNEVEVELNIRTWSDPAFKAKLMQNPHEALQECGVKLPAQAKVHVHEEDHKTWHITLRQAPPHKTILSAEQLRSVAGGNADTECCCS